MKRVSDGLNEQERRIGSKEKMHDFMRIATLQAIDEAWVEQVDYLQQLQSAVNGRSSAQRNPLFEYQSEALESFKKMEKTILKNIVRNILLSNVYVDEEGELRILLP
jgi:preprotein translocase subunit SecA